MSYPQQHYAPRGRGGPVQRGGAVPRQNPGITMHELQAELLREEIRQERRTDPDSSGKRPAEYRQAAARQVRAERQMGIDTHELLKREAFADDVPGCDSHFEKNRPCPNGVFGVSDQYILLDSFEKLPESNTGGGVFTWNFMVQGVTGNQVMGVRDVVDTVIEIEMGSFPMPILPEVPYVLQNTFVGFQPTVILLHNNTNGATGAPLLANNQYPQNVGTVPATAFAPWVNNPYTQLPFGGRFTVLVSEAGLQSFSDGNGARHNFEYELSSPAMLGWNPNMVLAKPIRGSGIYVFTDPLKDVHGITLTFRSFDLPLSFLPDVYYEAVVTSAVGAGPPNPAAPFLVFNIPNHSLNQGDRFFVSGFNSGSPTLDTYVNRAVGHVAAGDPTLPALSPGTLIPDPDNFFTDPAIGLAALGVPAPVLPKLAVVRIAKRRLLVPVRFRRVVSRLTNYITAV